MSQAIGNFGLAGAGGRSTRFQEVAFPHWMLACWGLIPDEFYQIIRRLPPLDSTHSLDTFYTRP
jgi:hypothetical protein